MKRLFLTGVVFWVPVLVIYWVLYFLYGLVLKSLYLEPIKSLTEGLSTSVASLFSIFFITALVLSTGILVTNFIGRRLVVWFEYTVKKLPLISSIYSTVKQSLEMIFDEHSQSFREVVLVRFPSESSWSVGFVTNRSEQGMLTVFIPTTPNPTSGYILFVDHVDAVKVDMSVDQALKFVISLGTTANPDVTRLIAQWPEKDKKDQI
ncbi:DUF502 domain-containing protein [Gammaproteobacteria bacterium]|nr:DUF502 domain-containing protein [Gammaproteobacteria bacterium]